MDAELTVSAWPAVQCDTPHASQSSLQSRAMLTGDAEDAVGGGHQARRRVDGVRAHLRVVFSRDGHRLHRVLVDL